MVATPTWRDERGVGLPELLVAMTLLAILMTIVVGAFSSFTTRFTEDRSSTDSTNVAAVGMNELTRVIRSGTEIPVINQVLNRPVFTIVKKEAVTLHAYLDTDSFDPEPIKVEFTINSRRELVERRFLATRDANGYWFFSTVAASSKVVARQIVVPRGSEASLFTYVRANGTALTVPAAGITDLAVLREIAAVEVTMKVQADSTARANPVTVTNRVGIPNLGISRVGL